MPERTRQGYDDGFGVARVEWHHGAPPSDFLGEILVEIWTPSLSIDFEPATKPRVTVRARVEVWTRRHAEPLQRLENGRLQDVNQPHMLHVRRWARLPDRYWHQTVALGGWEPQR